DADVLEVVDARALHADQVVAVGDVWRHVHPQRLRAWVKRTMLPAGSRNAQSRTPYGWSIGSWSTSPPPARMCSNVASQSGVVKFTARSMPLASSSDIARRSAGDALGSAAGGSRTMVTSGCSGEPTDSQRMPSNLTSLRTSRPS